MTVRRLVQHRDLGLKLIAGRQSVDRAISWAHATELPDPAPYLSGGELVMTTGMTVGHTDIEQFDYVSRLSAAGVAALAFDTGTTHRTVPGGIISAGDAVGMPVLAVPAATPFIAITRAVIDEATADQLRSVQRVVTQQEVMAREAVSNGIPAIVTNLSKSLSATVVVLATDGGVLAVGGPDAQRISALATAHIPRRANRRTPGAGSRVIPDGDGVCLLQALSAAQPLRGYLAVRCDEPLSPTERLLVSHAVSLISIELNKPTKVIDAEQRLRAAVLRALLAAPPVIEPAVLRYFDFDPAEPVVVVALSGIGPILAAEQTCRNILDRTDTPYLLCTHTDQVAIVLPDKASRLAKHVSDEVAAQLQRRVTAGVSLAGGFADLAVCLAQAQTAARSNGGDGNLNAFADLGVFGVLLGNRTPAELDLITRPLAALDAHDRARSAGDPGLVDTLAIFLGHNGHLESAAAELQVHRHTMRNRVARIQQLIGRDLDNPDVRAALWLAVKARELRGIQGGADIQGTGGTA